MVYKEYRKCGLENIDVVILCGGLGKRLRPVVDDRPKPMAIVRGKPFLDILIASFASSGFQKFILCCGYRREFIKNYYRNNSKLKIYFSPEDKPLGTGGAVKNAKPLIKSSTFLISNGDSFCELDVKKFLEFHLRSRSLITIAVNNKKGNSASGLVCVNSKHRVTGFYEKKRESSLCLVNAGIYLFQKEAFDFMPRENYFSLEEDFFPMMLNRIYGYICEGLLIDIGTPKSYAHANSLPLVFP